MSLKRKHELVESTDPVVAPFLWDLCLLCQNQSKERLITPRYEGYLTMAKNLAVFAEHGQLPSAIRNLDQLDDGSGISQTLVAHAAKYHKSCKNKYDSQKAERLSGEKKQQGRPQCSDNAPSTSKLTRSSLVCVDAKKVCLFCDEGEDKDKLVTASTLGIGPTIHSHALQLQDGKLLTKLSSTDLVALEGKYHKLCYTRFLTRARASERSRRDNYHNPEEVVYGSVITELVQYMQDMYSTSSTSPVFKLSYLTKLVVQRMTDMGIQTEEKNLNRTRLKEQLLAFIPGLRADKSGREVFFSFEEDVGDAIRDACAYNDFSDGMCLGRAVGILRRDLFKEFPKFEGSFNDLFTASKSVPAILLHFVRMLLEGPNIDPDVSSERPEHNAGLSIAQLIRYNSIKHKRKDQVQSVRHVLERETPLPLYVGLMVHAVTKKKKIIDKLSRLGLSVTYNRVQEVSATVTNVLCKKYMEDGVYPPKLCPTVFVTSAIDNIDHNQSSSTAVTSFHGSSVTIIQHPYSEEIMEIDDDSNRIRHWNQKIVNGLPEYYTTLPATGKVTSDPPLPTVNPWYTDHDPAFTPTKVLHPWLNSVMERLDIKDIPSIEQLPRVSFAAFHANNEPGVRKIRCNASLLPLLNDEIATPSMVRHMMDIIVSATAKLNENQTPVITCDQPVYAIGKQLQWKFPDKYGEDRIIFMMGGLHIEMMVINLLGKWLTCSGWTELITTAGVATSGVAESFLTSSHVKRSRYAHEITLTALHYLQKQAFTNACETDASIIDQGFEQWVLHKNSDCPQFQYWNTVIELESLLVQLVLSIRTSNFTMFVDTLNQLCPWAFALDAVNYSRWLPVFVRTLQDLPEKHPDVHAEFLRGNFTSSKTGTPFSAISDDQLHEHNNKVIKGEGGAIGILDSEHALLKWMVAGPRISSLIEEFEEKLNLKDDKVVGAKHHEDTNAFEKRFLTHAKEMIHVLTEHGNPFEVTDLVAIGSSQIIPSIEAVKCVTEGFTVGLKKYNEYVMSRLDQVRNAIHEVIPRANIHIFKAKTRKTDKANSKISNLRKDSNLFCRLYVASEARDGNIDDFFSHENQMYPPSISDDGKLRKPTNKSDIIDCILTKCDISVNHNQPDVTAKIFDGAAVIHMLNPGIAKTFLAYYENVFKQYFTNQLKNCSRIDIAFDRYTSNSLKADTRESRGSGISIKVSDSTTIPKQFKQFLCVNENKTQLFHLLAKKMVSDEYPGKQVLCTYDDQVLTSTPMNVDSISPTSHEEADGRLLLHVKHAVDGGHARILIRTVDSDVVVISISLFSQIQGIEELWIEYGCGKYRKLIPIHDICSKLAPEISRNLISFHSITGCDTVSTFCGVGKKTAWKVWMSFREIDGVLHQLCTGTSEIDDKCHDLLQRFVILLYDQSSDLQSINDCRRVLFTRKNRAIENIPPTADALTQHIKRATLQARIWNNSLFAHYTIPSPSNWGWKDSSGGSYRPVWTTIPEVSKHCVELTSCTCRKRCTSCKCVKMYIPCTKLCVCEGQCSDSDR